MVGEMKRCEFVLLYRKWGDVGKVHENDFWPSDLKRYDDGGEGVGR